MQYSRNALMARKIACPTARNDFATVRFGLELKLDRSCFPPDKRLPPVMMIYTKRNILT